MMTAVGPLSGAAGARPWNASRARFALPYLSGGPGLSPALQWRLVETLYGQSASMIAGGSAMLTLGIIEWLRYQSPWWLAWTVAAGLVLAWRLRESHAFGRRRQQATARQWARRFSFAMWAIGAWWGIGSLAVMLLPDDPLGRMTLIAVQAGYLGGATVRNSASPAAAEGQIYLALPPLIAGCLMSGNTYYLLFAIFVVQHFAASVFLVRFLAERTTRLLAADDHNAQLLQEIGLVNEELKRSNARLEELATHDPLTRLANRRAFDRTLETEWKRAVRSGQPLSLLIIDIDRFKLHNDSFGHPAGDDALRAIAAAIGGAVRDAADLAARYGGEEFAVVLPFTDHASAMKAAEKLRALVAGLNIRWTRDNPAPLTVSVGVATVRPDRGGDPASLIAAADKALYAAKEAGRNQVRGG